MHGWGGASVVGMAWLGWGWLRISFRGRGRHGGLAGSGEELGEFVVFGSGGGLGAVVASEFGVEDGGAELVGKSEVETAFC